jgi:magnesium and cobalt transporter
MQQRDQSPGLLGSLFNRLAYFLRPIPVTREQLFDVLRRARKRDLLDEDALPMMHRIMQVSELQVEHVMVARAQMVTIDSSETIEEILPTIIDSAHSRFPVIDGDRDQILGILLAKDLLRYRSDSEKDRQSWEKLVRPAVFIPESKRLNVLLQEFRDSRNHMAIVVDEYGGVIGLVTIEDVLEQIVGEIEDETDVDEESKMVLRRDENDWVIKAELPISSFNHLFETDLNDRDVDTVGGIVTNELGHVPKRGERVVLAGHEVEVLSADGRRARLLRINVLSSS